MVTEEYLNELIIKSWQEIDATQQQIASIDTSTPLGTEVAKLLKSACTNYYVLIGCLESLAENPTINVAENTKQKSASNSQELEPCDELSTAPTEQNKSYNTIEVATSNFEPFEYFVDFEEPSGLPLTDNDLYS